jgi:hypothetical protein
MSELLTHTSDDRAEPRLRLGLSKRRIRNSRSSGQASEARRGQWRRTAQGRVDDDLCKPACGLRRCCGSDCNLCLRNREAPSDEHEQGVCVVTAGRSPRRRVTNARRRFPRSGHSHVRPAQRGYCPWQCHPQRATAAPLRHRDRRWAAPYIGDSMRTSTTCHTRLTCPGQGKLQLSGAGVSTAVPSGTGCAAQCAFRHAS